MITGSVAILIFAVTLMLLAVGSAVWAKLVTRRERRRRAALQQARRAWAEYVFTECVPDLRSDEDHAAWLNRHGGQPPAIPPLPR